MTVSFAVARVKSPRARRVSMMLSARRNIGRPVDEVKARAYWLCHEAMRGAGHMFVAVKGARDAEPGRAL